MVMTFAFRALPLRASVPPRTAHAAPSGARRLALAGACLAALLGTACAPSNAAAPAKATATGPAHVTAADDVAAGRYLVTIGGCNDCHTVGWDVTGGGVPEGEWLTGSPVGWRGPWGTTYPSNLRLIADEMDEEAFVSMLHTRKDSPPMPWMNVNRMHEADARAIYRFLKALGPAGRRMPHALPPGQEPQTPFIPIAPPANLPAKG